MKFFPLALFYTSFSAATTATTVVPNTGKPLPSIGENLDGDSVFTNYDTLKTNKQAFLLGTGYMQHEYPGSEQVSGTFLKWISSATFSNTTTSPSYTARIISYMSADFISDALAAGSTIAEEQAQTGGDPDLMASMYIPQMNINQIVIAPTSQDWTATVFDDGRNISVYLASEGDDQGDTSVKAPTAAFSSHGTMEWIGVEQAGE